MAVARAAQAFDYASPSSPQRLQGDDFGQTVSLGQLDQAAQSLKTPLTDKPKESTRIPPPKSESKDSFQEKLRMEIALAVVRGVAGIVQNVVNGLLSELTGLPMASFPSQTQNPYLNQTQGTYGNGGTGASPNYPR